MNDGNYYTTGTESLDAYLRNVSVVLTSSLMNSAHQIIYVCVIYSID